MLAAAVEAQSLSSYGGVGHCGLSDAFCGVFLMSRGFDGADLSSCLNAMELFSLDGDGVR